MRLGAEGFQFGNPGRGVPPIKHARLAKQRGCEKCILQVFEGKGDTRREETTQRADGKMKIELRGYPPPPVFCAKSAELLDSKGFNKNASAKECGRVSKQRG